MSTRAGNAARAAWGPTVAAIGLVIVVTLWLYRQTAVGMATLWSQSETFAHGYLVPFISLWLIWRQRKALAAVTPALSPAPLFLAALALIATVWLAGDLGGVNTLTQFALISMIVLSVPALAGWAATRVILFPLAFLFFAVPFGDFLLPLLMARTADFTVLALRASGIPVYRDGLQFVIPSGTWSVVEACSGVRYLIASLMVGSLFAYLNYRSPRRRLTFMLVALAVPIVANWLRAYMIVMIGHLSSNTVAVGVDHLVYGWLFFGVVVGTMFLIGARWSQPPADTEFAVQASAQRPPQAARLLPMAAAILAVLLLPPLILHGVASNEDRSAPQFGTLADPAPVAALGPALPLWTPAFANPAATLERRFMVRGQPVGLYVGYYRAQGPGSRLVSSINALVSSGDDAWVQSGAGKLDVTLAGRTIPLKTASLRRPVSSSDASSLVVWQSYWVDGRFEASDVKAKAWGAWQRLRGRGDDGAVVIVYASEQAPVSAAELLESFLQEHLPSIEGQLKKTSHGD